MAAFPPRPARRRPRLGSLERPVSGRLYRGTWLLVGMPLLIAAFSVHKAAPLPAPQPALPPSFDRSGTLALAADLAGSYPDRVPGTAGAAGAVGWVSSQLAPYGLRAVDDRFRALVPGHGRQTLVNQLVTIPGRLPTEIVVMAHRDDSGVGPGANDNASGIATLVQLARSYGTPVAAPGTRAISPLHTLVFVATDGGAFGALGARRFARTHTGRALAVIDLAALAGRGPPRLVLTGSEPRLASPGMVETAAQRILELSGSRPHRPTALAQLIDLAFPFTLYEQGPLLAPGTSSYVYFGPRLLPGWAIELVLISALAPFLLAAVDLFARCRRRHIPLAPAFRSYRSRAGFWLWTAAIFEFFALVGVWPSAPAVALPPDVSPATHWPALGLVGFSLLS